MDIEMTYDEWKEKYKPTLDYMLDEIPKGQNPLTIWTECNMDMYNWISSGYHYVNRMGYWITEVPFEEGEEIFIALPQDEPWKDED